MIELLTGFVLTSGLHGETWIIKTCCL